MFPDVSLLVAELSADVAGRGSLHHRGGTILLLPGGSGWPVRLSQLDDDLFEIETGMSTVIPVGADEPSDYVTVREVVGAILRGDVEEHFGDDENGVLGPIGYRVWYQGGSRSGKRLEDSVICAVLRAPAWPAAM